jgi:hypothetical protein
MHTNSPNRGHKPARDKLAAMKAARKAQSLLLEKTVPDVPISCGSVVDITTPMCIECPTVHPFSQHVEPPLLSCSLLSASFDRKAELKRLWQGGRRAKYPKGAPKKVFLRRRYESMDLVVEVVLDNAKHYEQYAVADETITKIRSSDVSVKEWGAQLRLVTSLSKLECDTATFGDFLRALVDHKCVHGHCRVDPKVSRELRNWMSMMRRDILLSNKGFQLSPARLEQTHILKKIGFASDVVDSFNGVNAESYQEKRGTTTARQWGKEFVEHVLGQDLLPIDWSPKNDNKTMEMWLKKQRSEYLAVREYCVDPFSLMEADFRICLLANCGITIISDSD